MTVAHRSPFGVVAALRADDLLDLGLHELVKDAESDADRQGHEALAGRSGELAKRLPDPFGQLLEVLLLGAGRVRRYGPHRGGSSSSRGLGRARQAPTGAGRGGRAAASSSTDYGTCSLRPREARYLALLAAGYSYAEIAEREGVTYTNVNKHLSRGALRARELREGGENGRRGA